MNATTEIPSKILSTNISNGLSSKFNSSTTIFGTIPTLVITQPSYYYTYSLYGYLIFLLLVCLFLIGIKLAYNKKQQNARQTAIARARRTASPVVATTVNVTNEPQKDDLPPAYNEIVQTKLALQAPAEEGRTPANTSPSTQTTIALATIVDASGSTAASPNSSAIPRETISSAESYETLPPAYENAVFEHEDSINGRTESRTNTL